MSRWAARIAVSAIARAKPRLGRLTSNTGRCAVRTTASATLPRSARAGPVSAWVLMTMRSAPAESAARTIAAATSPVSTRASAATPSRRSAAASPSR